MISRKTTVSAAALLMASAGAAAAFPATAVTDLNVRSGPGTGYSVVDVLQDGETVEVVARAGGWYQLANGGWASGNYLDEGGAVSVGADFGPVAFYYGDHPYYWDDAGYYFYIDGGRRHRVGWDWFRDRDYHRDFRWSDNRHRGWFERRFNRFVRGDWDDDRRGRGDGDRWSRGDDDDRRGRGDGDRWSRGDNDDGRRFGGRDSDRDRGQDGMREGRASAEENRGDGPDGDDSDARGGERRGGGEGQRRLEDNIPGGGY